MKTQKIVRFTRNFDRRHRTDVYLYANTYEDITSLIENEINDNVYGISDYPIHYVIFAFFLVLLFRYLFG